jgi:hypothetical protein
MTDEEFIRALESCRLPESEFGHAAHVRAGYSVTEIGGAANESRDIVVQQLER